MLKKLLLIAGSVGAVLAMPAVAGAATATVPATQWDVDTAIQVKAGDVLVATASPDFNVCGGFDGTPYGYCFTGSLATWPDPGNEWAMNITYVPTAGANYRIGDSTTWLHFTASTANPAVSEPVTATTSGLLHVTTNDRWWPYNGYPDNRGSIGVTVTPPSPTHSDQCKKDGWKTYGTTFKNQGDCVSYVATGGKNKPAGS